MRVLVVSAPFPEHAFPVVPLAWELRSAGHDVLVATAAEAVRVADAGLPVADGTVALADEWAPDLVVHDALAPVGALVAARRRVPAALYDHTFFGGHHLSFATTGHLSYTCGRHSVDAPATPAVVIRLAPPSMVGRHPCRVTCAWRSGPR